MTVAGSPCRYAAAAGFCFCLHNAILIVCDRVGLTMLQSAVTSFCIMVVVGYLLMAGPVFRGAFTFRGFGRYALAMAMNFPVATSFLWIGMKILSQPMTIAAPAAAIGMVIVNYVLSRWAVIGQWTAPRRT